MAPPRAEAAFSFHYIYRDDFEAIGRRQQSARLNLCFKIEHPAPSFFVFELNTCNSADDGICELQNTV